MGVRGEELGGRSEEVGVRSRESGVRKWELLGELGVVGLHPGATALANVMIIRSL